MKTTEISFVPPVECAPWCSHNDGHPADMSAIDQVCYSPSVDVGVKFTAAEARWLAAELLKTAELVEDGCDPSRTGSP